MMIRDCLFDKDEILTLMLLNLLNCVHLFEILGLHLDFFLLNLVCSLFIQLICFDPSEFTKLSIFGSVIQFD